jgi:hypothetical protein
VRETADRPRAFAVISEAVWWVTMVDATLVRHDPGAYDGVLAGQTPAQRQLVEGTLSGLRFVQNQTGEKTDLAEFLEPGEASPGHRRPPVRHRVRQAVEDAAINPNLTAAR